MGMTIQINDAAGTELCYLGKGGNYDYYLWHHYLPAHIVASYDYPNRRDNRSVQGLTGMTCQSSLKILEDVRDAMLTRDGRWAALERIDAAPEGVAHLAGPVFKTNGSGDKIANGPGRERADGFYALSLVCLGEMIEKAKAHPHGVWEIAA